MIEKGSYHELLSQSTRFARLLENIYQQEQHKSASHLDVKRSSRSLTVSETDVEDIVSASITFETKQEGVVKWSVYLAYLKAGIGLICGVMLIMSVFGLREATSVFYNWWLAKWSNEQIYRYHASNNCSQATPDDINSIKSMTDQDWTSHQRQKFIVYAGLSVSLKILDPDFSLIGAGVSLLLINLIHVVFAKFICWNASRVLHQK